MLLKSFFSLCFELYIRLPCQFVIDGARVDDVRSQCQLSTHTQLHATMQCEGHQMCHELCPRILQILVIGPTSHHYIRPINRVPEYGEKNWDARGEKGRLHSSKHMEKSIAAPDMLNATHGVSLHSKLIHPSLNEITFSSLQKQSTSRRPSTGVLAQYDYICVDKGASPTSNAIIICSCSSRTGD